MMEVAMVQAVTESETANLTNMIGLISGFGEIWNSV